MADELFAGVWARRRPGVMGILNVTPDSFSDGGRFLDAAAAVARALELVTEGADVIDVGGESTRPGAAPVSEALEADRVVPVIAELARLRPGLPISVDTGKPAVADAALSAGAVMVNDVTAARDEGMLRCVAAHGAAIVLMHMRGEPRTMQADTCYGDVVAEVHEFLAGRAAEALASGIPADRVFLDPGIGFGKDVEGNLRLLGALSDLAGLGHPVVVGASRKSFIGALTGAGAGDRLAGSLAAIAGACALPRVLLRVHDAAATVQFVTVLQALRSAA